MPAIRQDLQRDVPAGKHSSQVLERLRQRSHFHARYEHNKKVFKLPIKGRSTYLPFFLPNYSYLPTLVLTSLYLTNVTLLVVNIIEKNFPADFCNEECKSWPFQVALFSYIFILKTVYSKCSRWVLNCRFLGRIRKAGPLVSEVTALPTVIFAFDQRVFDFTTRWC